MVVADTIVERNAAKELSTVLADAGSVEIGLVLENVFIDADDLNSIICVSGLRALTLTGEVVDDTWIQGLAKSGSRLEELHLENTLVSSVGVEEIVKLTRLRVLVVTGSRLSPIDAERFTRRRPDVTLVWR